MDEHTKMAILGNLMADLGTGIYAHFPDKMKSFMDIVGCIPSDGQVMTALSFPSIIRATLPGVSVRTEYMVMEEVPDDKIRAADFVSKIMNLVDLPETEVIPACSSLGDALFNDIESVRLNVIESLCQAVGILHVKHSGCQFHQMQQELKNILEGE